MYNTFKGKYGPLLICEIGGNHEGDFAYAKHLVKLAIKTNVDFIKLQIYSGDTLVSSLESPDRNKHFKKFELSRNQYLYLAKMIVDAGIKFTSSVWDISTLDWINEYIPIYKIGSGDLTAYPIIREITKTKKPIILSTGLSTEKEIINAINFIQETNPIYKNENNLALLQCTSMYPIKPEDANLNIITYLKKKTNLTVGYSDHTEGVKSLLYAYAMGAEILEFHFTDTRHGKKFRDHKVSLTPKEVTQLTDEINLIHRLQGTTDKKPIQIELENNHPTSFRRAVYPSVNIVAGEILSEKNLTVLRPNHGIDAREFDTLLGKKALINIQKHQKLDWIFFD